MGYLRVLLVDDEPDIRTVGQLALELGGFSVELASSGAEALAQAQTTLPDVILLDVMMPVTDGPTTLLNLRAIREVAHIPVVFLTAKVQPSEIQRYLALGALAVIAKPFDPLELGQNLRGILAKAA